MSAQGIHRVSLTNFTAFADCKLEFCPGINVLVGPNATGKTHVMKLLYSALVAHQQSKLIGPKLIDVFLPHERRLGRLVRRQRGRAGARIRVDLRSPGPTDNGQQAPWVSISFSSHAVDKVGIRGQTAWREAVNGISTAYIPAKEILASAPGFLSLCEAREVSFDETYADLLHRAFRLPLRGKPTGERKKLLDALRQNMTGKVEERQERFFLRNKEGMLEFSLLAEGIRKLGLLYVLIQNGVLNETSVLFWDEPETNLNPSLIGVVAGILLELQRQGAQIILATHDDVLLAELDLSRTQRDSVRFLSLYREGGSGPVQAAWCDRLDDLHPNVITDVRAELLAREVSRVMAGGR